MALLVKRNLALKWKMLKFKTKYRFLTKDGRGNVSVAQFIPWNNKNNIGAKTSKKGYVRWNQA